MEPFAGKLQFDCIGTYITMNFVGPFLLKIVNASAFISSKLQISCTDCINLADIS